MEKTETLEIARKIRTAFGPNTPTYECLTDGEMADRVGQWGVLGAVGIELDRLDIYLDRIGASTEDFHSIMQKVRDRLISAGVCRAEEI
jgi:hypothetical protein